MSEGDGMHAWSMHEHKWVCGGVGVWRCEGMGRCGCVVYSNLLTSLQKWPDQSFYLLLSLSSLSASPAVEGE